MIQENIQVSLVNQAPYVQFHRCIYSKKKTLSDGVRKGRHVHYYI